MKVIVDIKGGLGNQMFCYAFGYSIAKQHDAELWLDTTMLDRQQVNGRSFELDNYAIEYEKRLSYKFQDSLMVRKLGINRVRKKNAIGWKTEIYREKRNYQFDDCVSNVCVDTYYDGFWQNYRYFADNRKQLIKMFKPVNPVDEAVLFKEKEIKEKSGISLHVRRGDYVGLKWQLSMEYYHKALEVLKKKLNADTDRPLNIFVFSDDIEYSREYFDSHPDNLINYYYVKYESTNNSLYDMYLTSCCSHNIIANSSFSWWGGWLNNDPDKIVVCPLKGVWNDVIYPKEWIGISTD